MSVGHSATGFYRWRVDTMKLSRAEAARLLEKNVQTILNFDFSFHRSTGAPSFPDLATRYYMTIIAMGPEVEPAPQNNKPPYLTMAERVLMTAVSRGLKIEPWPTE